MFLLYSQQFIDDLYSVYDDINIDVLIEDLNKSRILENANIMKELLDKSFKQIKIKIESEDGYNVQDVEKIKTEIKNIKNNINTLLKNKIQ